MDNKTHSQLQKVHGLHLMLAKEVARLCEKHGLRYFLIAGTLLGAVRHGGFIPWDDDMDIGLLREDYDRFLVICAEELDTQVFFLQTTDTDPYYALPFAKLQLVGTRFLEQNASGHAAAGIYLDVFPFDNVPENLRLRRRHNRRLYVQKRLLLAKMGYKPWASTPGWRKRAVYALLSLGAHLRTRKGLAHKLEQELRRYNASPTDLIVAGGGSYGYTRETIRRDWIAALTPLPFEDATFTVPAAYTDYLTYFYGDYMTPPPPEKRYDRHSIVEIDFGPYEDILIP